MAERIGRTRLKMAALNATLKLVNAKYQVRLSQ